MSLYQRFARISPLLPLVLQTAGALAQPAALPPPEPRWMQIEVVAFRHESGENGGERFPPAPQLAYPAPLRFLIEPGSPAFTAAVEAREFERALQAEAGSAAPPGPAVGGAAPVMPPPDELPGVLLTGPDTVLAETAARIGSAPGYRLLAHLAWREPRLTEGSKEHVLVTGGASSGDHRELEGSITITQGRFVHIDTSLWLNDFPTPGQSPGPDAVELPPIPQPVLPASPQPAAQAPTADAAISASPLEATPIAVEPVRASRSVALVASRRIAPGEVHYIDHPLLGLIVMMRPWDPALPPPATAEPSAAQPTPTAPVTPAAGAQPPR